MIELSKTALITGATGFIGSRLSIRLVSEGWRLHAIVRPTSNLEPLRPVIDRITLHSHDGTMEDMLAILKRIGPDIVFHLASFVASRHEPADLVPMLQSNVVFAAQLAEAMVINGIYCLINTGTQFQHYDNKDYSPSCLYAATKQAYESLLQYYVETTSLKVITLKLFDTYGPLDPRPKLITLLRNTARNNVPLPMSPGEQLIDLVYIEDVLDAYLIASDRMIAGKTADFEHFAVSSGNAVNLKELVRIYEQVIGRPLPILWGERPYRQREIMVSWDKGIPLPGWKAKWPLHEGIRHVELESK